MKGWAREGDFYGNSIAVAIRSLDHSLSIRLIPAYGRQSKPLRSSRGRIGGFLSGFAIAQDILSQWLSLWRLATGRSQRC